MTNHEKPTAVARPAFTITGYGARTTNAREISGEGQIAQLWAKMKIQIGSEFVALYTDYESDKDGAYTYVLGTVTENNAAVPEGMIRRSAAAGEYAVLKAYGKLAPDAVVRIWSLESSGAIARTYVADYDIYRFGEAGESTIEVYVGVQG